MTACYNRSNFAASEALRQIALIESGKSVSQETRGFDENTAETFTLRSKEDAPDYRYMPDPNLPPIMIDEVGVSPPNSPGALNWITIIFVCRDLFSLFAILCQNFLKRLCSDCKASG
jgi:hypothetical protein